MAKNKKRDWIIFILILLLLALGHTLAWNLDHAVGASMPKYPKCASTPLNVNFATVRKYQRYCEDLKAQYYRDKSAWENNQKRLQGLLAQAERDNDTVIYNSDGTFTIIQRNDNRRRR